MLDKIKPFTGQEYLESIQDNREVWIYGEKVQNIIEHPAFRNFSRSASSVTGYLSKSLGSLNWVGLTKMLQTLSSQAFFDASIKAKCPSCKAPIVGTNPMDFPLDFRQL